MASKDLPTGCYKCGRPGHWSRDCPSQPAATSDAAAKPKPPITPAAPAAKTKRGARRKLTADLLLSDKGLGYVLEKLPQMVNIKGPGHEAEDLASLLHGYKSWHNAFFPSMSYKRFVGEVESLGSVKRVKLCLDDLRSRVASGHDLKGAIQATGSRDLEEERSGDEGQAVHEARHGCQEDEEDTLQQAAGPAKATLDKAQLERMEANRRKALERRALAQQQQQQQAAP